MSEQADHDQDRPDDEDPQTVAERTSKIVQPSNPRVEPPNSTVDDWFGQRVQHDADLLDAGLIDTDDPNQEHQRGESAAGEPWSDPSADATDEVDETGRRVGERTTDD